MACISKRRDRYVIDFYDSQGKRRWKTLPKGATKAKAKEVLRGIEDRLAKGNYVPDSKVPTFSEVAQDWLEHKKSNLRASTWSVYESHTRIHFEDLNPLRIDRINTARVEKYISDRQRQGMHILTLRKILVSLGQIMGYAVRHGLIPSNPVRDAERPRGQGKAGAVREIGIMRPDEITRLVEAAADQKVRTLFMLAALSGARQGELLGLKWADVDWENGQIHIQRTFNNRHWFEVKTKKSNRRIDLGPAMMKALADWKEACPATELDLVFPNDAGRPMDHNNLYSRHFKPALRRAGLPHFRFHDLRHTYVSLLIEQGENVLYIQKQLGHASPTITMNVYAHLIKTANMEAPKRLEERVLKEG